VSNLNHKVRALGVLATHCGVELRDVLSLGWRHLGVAGGNHVIRDEAGRLWGVDLVLDRVTMYVGLAPRIEEYT